MILLGKVVLGIAGAGLAGAGALCSEGLVQVKVIEKQPQGHHINIIVPAMLAPVAMHLAPRATLAQAAQQVEPYLPLARTTIDALRDSDDLVLVDVKEPGEHIQVSKLAGSIIVDASDPNETVHVSAPLRAISSTIAQLAAATANPLSHTWCIPPPRRKSTGLS